jgi:molybdopterin-guanine dinucleotide biosynthesis protein A
VTDWTAIVLTGGASRRLGRDKATTPVAGRRMIDRILAGLPPEVPVVVVGPDPHVRRPITLTREDPPGGGPAAGIAAGIAVTSTPFVAVLATDMPSAVPALLQLPLPAGDALVPRTDGHAQPLCAWYRTTALRRAAPAAGMSMREVLARLAVEYVDVAAAALVDIDTAQDLHAAQQRLIMDDMDTWVEAVKRELGITADVDVAVVLDVAKEAAHAVQRPAAPVTTYLMGLAVANGADPGETAVRIAGLAQSWSGDA